MSPHNTHFHIYLNPPAPIGITASLLAGNVVDAPQAAGVADLQTAAQTLLNQIQSETQEETLMFIMDVPNIPAQEPPVMVADATATQGTAQQFDRVIGVCHLSENPFVPKSAANVLSPPLAMKNYFRIQEHYKIEGQASVSVLKMPAHGTLVDGGDGDFVYYPEKGCIGNDRASLLVEVGGKRIKMEYFFRVMQSIPQQYEDQPNVYEQGYCPTKARVWKISSTTDANGNNLITAVDYQSYISNINGTTPTDTGNATLDAATVTSILGTSILNSLINSTSGITVNIADLPNGALGQTTGSVNSAFALANSGLPTFSASITLDDNAAGNGWFIDTTPGDNSEFLPTSNPYEWVAKAGSAAYGKMDMLSVLLHEYGHALGIEHSADANDYMGTTLTAGVRRLPSADELALMQQLVSGVKDTLSPTPLPGGGEGQNGPSQLPLLPLGGFGLAFLGRLRSSRYGSINIEADLSTLVTQYAVTANAKLTNGTFTSANGMPVDNGWATQGSVDFTPSTSSGQTGSATLKESTTSQTRLNQVFVVNPRDRFLNFTLDGEVLKDPLPNPLPPAGEGANVAAAGSGSGLTLGKNAIPSPSF